MIENFSSEFLAFCRSKPAREEYPAVNYARCALAQFVKSKGFNPGGMKYGHRSGSDWTETFDYPTEAYNAAVHDPKDENYAGWYTFGALVQRLEAAGVK